MDCLAFTRNKSGSNPSFPSIRANFLMQISTHSIGMKLPSCYIVFFNYIFKRFESFINHFWFWWYIIQQPITKIFDLLHAFVNEFFVLVVILGCYLQELDLQEMCWYSMIFLRFWVFETSILKRANFHLDDLPTVVSTQLF